MRVATKIYADEAEVGARLVDFGVTRAELWHVVTKVIGARRDAVADDPLGTSGQFAYIFGNRHLRGLLRAKGWERYRAENVEAVREPESGRIIVYQNVDLAGHKAHSPLAPRGKGNGARRLLDATMLFSAEELPEIVPSYVGENSENWYFCVSFETTAEGVDEVGAELSLPLPFTGDNFAGFLERIIILPHGPWSGGSSITRDVDTSDAAEFEPMISRKQQ